MRIAPIGCLFTPDQRTELIDYVYGVSQATHTSDVTIAGAAMIAEGAASAICGAFTGYSKINPEYTELLRVQNPETDFAEYINILEKGRELSGCLFLPP